MSINLIPTKLIIPKRQLGVIRRSRLVEFLHEHLERKLLFVTAPAGYGKSTLLTEWSQSLLESDAAAEVSPARPLFSTHAISTATLASCGR